MRGGTKVGRRYLEPLLSIHEVSVPGLDLLAADVQKVLRPVNYGLVGVPAMTRAVIGLKVLDGRDIVIVSLLHAGKAQKCT